MRARTIRHPVLVLTTVLILSGCSGGDDDPVAATEATEAAAADTTTDEQDPELAGAEDEGRTPEAADDEPEPFDPDTEIHPADIEVREWGVGEVERPWEVLLLPDDFVLPATAHLVTWAPPEAPFDGGQHGISGSGAFRILQADPEEVAAFFTSRLPDQGWGLEDEQQQGDGGGWMQTWVTVLPFDDWPEDWMADERGVEVQARFTFIPVDGADHDTMQFHYRAGGVRHDWDD